MTFHDYFKLCLFQFSITFSIAFKFKTFLNYHQSFWSGCRKKVKFPGIFRDRIAEKLADFVGILQKFWRLVSPKKTVGKKRPISWELILGKFS